MTFLSLRFFICKMWTIMLPLQICPVDLRTRGLHVFTALKGVSSTHSSFSDGPAAVPKGQQQAPGAGLACHTFRKTGWPVAFEFQYTHLYKQPKGCFAETRSSQRWLGGSMSGWSQCHSPRNWPVTSPQMAALWSLRHPEQHGRKEDWTFFMAPNLFSLCPNYSVLSSMNVAHSPSSEWLEINVPWSMIQGQAISLCCWSFISWYNLLCSL